MVKLSPARDQHKAAWPAFPGLLDPAGVRSTRPWLCCIDTCPIKLTAIINDSPYICNIFFLETPNKMPLTTSLKAGVKPVSWKRNSWPWSYNRQLQSLMLMTRDEGFVFPFPCWLTPSNKQPFLTAYTVYPGLPRESLRMLTIQPEHLVGLSLMIKLQSHLL